ncbi:ankyrin repeat protein L63-like [Thraustotheca clavata]|uniref:Ankyrin repeat protein L63-like n=1 Tax=Thraustotheca clavata TaxID=74557 RepID=A0A1V9ZHP5_9STRA|nr:ankyrin repeat protein L63-like [Thraustotheca clavata]
MSLNLTVLDHLLSPRIEHIPHVLGTEKLIAIIVSYQNGWHYDTLMLTRLFREITSSDATLHARSLASFIEQFPAWIQRYGSGRVEHHFSSYRRKRLVHYGLILGNVHVLECFEQCQLLQITQQDLQLAGQHGHINVIAFLEPRIHAKHAAVVMDQAVVNGHLDIVKYLHQKRIPVSEAAYAEACSNGYDHVIRFLYEVGYRYFPWGVVANAAKQGHLGMIQFFHDIHYPELDGAVSIAADNGHMDIVEYLFEQRPYLWYSMPSNIAHYGFQKDYATSKVTIPLTPVKTDSLNLLVTNVLGSRKVFRLIVSYQHGADKETLMLRQELRGIDSTMDDGVDLLPAALKRFHKLFPDWLKSRGIDNLELHFPAALHRHLVYYAMVYNNVNILEYFHKIKTLELTYHDLYLAGSHGHMNVIKYLNSVYNGTSMLEITMQSAVAKGHYNVMQFLQEQGVEVPAECFQIACEKGHLDIVQYLYQLGAYDRRCKQIVAQTTINGHLDVLQFLHAKRFDGFDKYALLYAVEHGHLNIVRFLHSIRTEEMYGLVYDAIPGGHLDVVKFLHQNGYKHDIKSVLWYALTKGQRDIARYLQEEATLKKRWSRFSKQVAMKFQNLRNALRPQAPLNYSNALLTLEDVKPKDKSKKY